VVGDLVIVGAGGMGRCVADLVDAINRGHADDEPIRLVGVVDDGHPDPGLWRDRGIDLLGPVAALASMDPAVEFVLAIASPRAKQGLDQLLRQGGRRSPVLVHPNVHRGFDVQLGPGSVVCSHVSMENHIRVGRHVHINQNSAVGHDAVISDHVTLSPLSAVSGAVLLEEAAFVGTGASITQGLTIGRGATVGAGAAVIRDVAPRSTVVGVPARPVHGGSSGS
jgi:sugar O-acyltransferase (sialic acid O-acetyltransferase NeuD family)